MDGSTAALVAFLHAMPGSGKTYLIDRWLYLRQQRTKEAGVSDSAFFVVELLLDRSRKYAAEALRDELAAKLRITGIDPDAALRARLSGGFLRIENVDSLDAAHAVAGLIQRLNGCRVIVSGRWFDRGAVPARWRERPVGLLSPDQAAEQFIEEIGQSSWDELTQEQQEAVVTRTARLPLAIHLASAFLRKGKSVEWLLERLTSLTLQDVDDPRFGQSVLTVMVDELLTSLERTLRNQPWLADVDGLLHGFHRLGFAHPGGIGSSLAAAVSGLSSADLDDLLTEADSLHLIEREPGTDRFRLHPLIADRLTADIDREPADEAVTDWFCERLPAPADQTVHNTAWHEIHAEFDTLVSWLGWLSGSSQEGSHKGTKAQRSGTISCFRVGRVRSMHYSFVPLCLRVSTLSASNVPVRGSAGSTARTGRG
ncbi:MAG: hypothetical protein R3C19_00560 [Planctomycetaceae bacterium]